MSKRVEPCSSCGAGLVWLKHERTGNVAPVEAVPTGFGNLIADVEQGTYRFATKEEKADVFRDRWISHFATCPNAKAHQQRHADNTTGGQR